MALMVTWLFKRIHVRWRNAVVAHGGGTKLQVQRYDRGYAQAALRRPVQRRVVIAKVFALACGARAAVGNVYFDRFFEQAQGNATAWVARRPFAKGVCRQAFRIYVSLLCQ